MRLSFSIGLVLAAGFVLTGCDRDGVKVYQVTEQNSAASPATSAPVAMVPPVQNENAAPQLQFVLPSGWQQVAPSQMRVASFSVTNADGQTADIGIIPLPAGEDELALVNMWRDQVQLPATSKANSQPASVGSDPAKLFEVVGTAPEGDKKFPQRILVAELTRGATSWFFKMTGDEAFVTAQKDSFLQFLKSVSFGDSTVTPAAVASAPETDNSNDAASIWTIPSGWQALPHSPMLLAQFSVTGDNGAQAEVNVLELAGEGGGLAANVNRWRGQLGLEPISEILTTPLAAGGAQAQVVDFSGTNVKNGKATRLIGVIVPQNGQTWFYKLMGDDAAVTRQKDAFIKFIQSAKYPDAR